MEETQYTNEFYNSQRSRSRQSAFKVLPLIFKVLKVDSLLDIGCGTGEWLFVAKELGVKNILGVDGHYVQKDELAIPVESFYDFDLKEPLNLNRKFDMAMSLEVAEHLPDSAADEFVNSLIKHSNIILFSAAIKGQGGTYHINEQPQEYWIGKFRKLGFTPIDFLRPEIFYDPNIDWWYRQNILVFVSPDVLKTNRELQVLEKKFRKESYNLEHPELKFIKSNIKTSMGRFITAPFYSIKKLILGLSN